MKLDTAMKFGFILCGEYLIASFLFAYDHNWKKCIYFIACFIKDIAVILL